MSVEKSGPDSVPESRAVGRAVGVREIGRILRSTGAKRASHDRVELMSSKRLENKRKSDAVMNMSTERVEVRRQRRKKDTNVSVGGCGNVNRDARKYREEFDRKTRFWVCGVCGSDEGLESLQFLDNAMLTMIERSDLPVLYEMVVQSLRNAGSGYGEYVKSIEYEFNSSGMLRTSRYICKACYSKLKLGR